MLAARHHDDDDDIYIYIYRTSNEDDCFSVLHRAGDKSHLKFLEAIYISTNRPFLCRQLNNDTLNILGELLDTGVTWTFFFFFTPRIR